MRCPLRWVGLIQTIRTLIQNEETRTIRTLIKNGEIKKYIYTGPMKKFRGLELLRNPLDPGLQLSGIIWSKFEQGLYLFLYVALGGILLGSSFVFLDWLWRCLSEMEGGHIALNDSNWISVDSDVFPLGRVEGEILWSGEDTTPISSGQILPRITVKGSGESTTWNKV